MRDKIILKGAVADGFIKAAMKAGEPPVASSELLAALFEKFRDFDERVRQREQEILSRDLTLAGLRRLRDMAWWKYEEERKQAANE